MGGQLLQCEQVGEVRGQRLKATRLGPLAGLGGDQVTALGTKPGFIEERRERHGYPARAASIESGSVNWPQANPRRHGRSGARGAVSRARNLNQIHGAGASFIVHPRPPGSWLTGRNPQKALY
jgi:hypothetical protein